MTQVELKELLKDRVGWKQPTGFSFTLSTEAKATDSGIYFQDGYPLVKLSVLRDVQEKVDISESEFNDFLVDLKSQNALLAVGDVFQISNIFDEVLDGRENIFDDVLRKRMAITVGEIILTSTRSNHTERLSKEQIQQLFFEINGNSSGSQYNPNLPMYVGLKSRYGAAVAKLQDLLQQEKTLDTFTHRAPDYLNNDERFVWYVNQ